MVCATCGHENPDTAKFCIECGSPQHTLCPNGHENAPGAKFCAECGAPIAGDAARPASTPARAERRMVSVLFADIVGFTPFSESRDPEEVRALVTRYFDRAREIVERFRGTVDKFIGDAVMAWWGAVEAREDDAERAVRAALELVDMVRELGGEIGVPDLALRAGVLTGEASVGPGGNQQGLLVGDLVNTASRLQSIAEPGTVVVGESTRNLVSSAVEFEALGEQRVKGKEVPVKPYQALRVVAQRGGRGRAEGIEPPFTGRQEELRLLKDQLHATGRDQRGRLISIVGEGGIGKSRLAWELLKYIDGIAEPIYWHHGRSPAYGDGTAFWSIAEMIRGRAGIAIESDDRAKARMKLRTAVAEHLPSDEERRWVEPRLAALLGLEEMPTGDRDELFGAIRTFFQRIAEKGTLAMVFEDLHWADDGVLEFVVDLVERSSRSPILVVTLSRPELLERQPGWGSGRRNMLSMHLAPLPEEEMAQLVTGMTPGIPSEAVDAIVARAGGIPLYAVEFVRMLLGSGDLVREGETFTLVGDIADLAVPDSLAAVIGARLDRLDADDRALVQDAAVLGQSFTLQGLAAIRGVDPASLEEPLRALARQELFELDEDPRSAERGQHRFVQSLIREVAYGRLSLSDRHQRHLRVAEYFAGLDDPELAGVIASHYLAAHTTAPPGTEDLLDRGRTALIGAAHRAASLLAHAQALNLYRQALALSPEPVDRATILVEANEAAMHAGEIDAAVELGRQAIDAMAEAADEQGRLRAHVGLAATLVQSFRSDEAEALLEPVYAAIGEITTPDEVRLGLEMARAHMLNNESQIAVEVATRVLPTAEKISPPAVIIDGIISKATALVNLGQPLEAQSALIGAVKIADDHGLQNQAMRALNNLVVVQLVTDPRSSIELAEELWERSQRFASNAWVQRARADRAEWLPLLGRFDEAIEMLDTVDSDHMSPWERNQADARRLVISLFRSPDPGSGERLREAIDSWGAPTDAQVQWAATWYRGFSWWDTTDWEKVYETVKDTHFGGNAEMGLIAAVWLRRPDLIGDALNALDTIVPASGRLGAALRDLGNGAIEILEGDVTAGIERYAAGLDLLGAVSTPLDLAGWRAAFGALAGLDDPRPLAAATAAQDWVRAVDAAGLERIWATGLPGESVLQREQAG